MPEGDEVDDLRRHRGTERSWESGVRKAHTDAEAGAVAAWKRRPWRGAERQLETWKGSQRGFLRGPHDSPFRSPKS